MPMKPAAAEAAPPSRKPIGGPDAEAGDAEEARESAMAIARTTATIADGAVLATQVRHGAFLDRAGDLLHLVVARRQLVDPHARGTRRRRRRGRQRPSQGTAAELDIFPPDSKVRRVPAPHPLQVADILPEWSARKHESARRMKRVRHARDTRWRDRDRERVPARYSAEPPARRAPAPSRRRRARARRRAPCSAANSAAAIEPPSRSAGSSTPVSSPMNRLRDTPTSTGIAERGELGQPPQQLEVVLERLAEADARDRSRCARARRRRPRAPPPARAR